MRIPRVFVAADLPNTGEFVLSEAASHYLCKVLRMEAGRQLILFNNTGFEFNATISRADKRAALVSITQSDYVERESPLHTHLAVGISRGERMDWVIQKAVELGASAVTPLFTERSEVKLRGERLQKKMAHWQQVAISAAEQCQRNKIPEIHPAIDLATFAPNTELKLVLHHRAQQSLRDITSPKSVTLLIGPEGGLSEQEIEQCFTKNYLPLTLGPRVLRTETAPLTALTAVQLLWGDLMST